MTSFSHMRGALVGRKTTTAGFHMQTTSAMSEPKRWSTGLNTHIGKTYVDSSDKFVFCSKKRQNELSREGVCSKLLIHGPATLVQLNSSLYWITRNNNPGMHSQE